MKQSDNRISCCQSCDNAAGHMEREKSPLTHMPAAFLNVFTRCGQQNGEISSRAAGEVELGGQNGVLAGQNIVGEDFLLHILEAQTLDGVGEAFAGLALLAEEENGLFPPSGGPLPRW